MNYIIKKEHDAPAYLQIYRQMRDDIINQIYPHNSKLPSKRTLSGETGVSTVTVEHAYALLWDEGYIEPRERSGYFVCFRKDDGFLPATIQQASPAPVVKHPSGPAPEFPFSVFVKTMRRVISDFGEAILDRSPNSGCLELRQAICSYLARSRGILAETEQIIIGSGSEYLYSLIVELLGRDRRYAIESPSYQKIEQIYRGADVCCELLPLGCDGIESAALWACHADVLHISPYRSFPTGVTATASKRHEYIHWSKGKYIVEDDYESEFSVSKKLEETLFSLSSDENIIYMNTFSQTISPSLRVGYMVLPKPLVPVFAERLGYYSCTVPTYIQFVLAELLQNGDFERHINRVRRTKRKQCK